MAQRRKSFFIAGNWKMNPDTLDEARDIFSRISRVAKKISGTTVLIAPPTPFVAPLASRTGGPVKIGVQDVSDQPSGAFTGSVSARQMRSVGAEYAIIGHSERRRAGDTDSVVAEKVKRAIEAGLRVILCVGEIERDKHAKYFSYIRDQVVSVMQAIDPKQARWITVAYEPVWAVGKSYDTALKPSDIHEMSIYIRKVAAEVVGKKSGLAMPVLYGGSVDLENAKLILDNASIDGLLIGRQSLEPEAFANIMRYASGI